VAVALSLRRCRALVNIVITTTTIALFVFTLSPQNLGKGSLWMVEPSYRPCLIQALQKTPYTKGYSKKSTVNTNLTVRGETMEAVKDERSEDEMSTVSDVDAATAMLVLKRGPHVRIVHDRG